MPALRPYVPLHPQALNNNAEADLAVLKNFSRHLALKFYGESGRLSFLNNPSNATSVCYTLVNQTLLLLN